MRKNYNKGTCKQLKDDLYICFIFMDDDESSWSTSEINQIWFDQIKEAMYFINLNANYYKVHLDIKKGLYSSCERNTNVRYKGSINTDLFKKSVEKDVMEQVAKSLNFKSKQDMHQYLLTYTNKKQIAYVIMLNKKGISYAMDHVQGNSDHLEYCVIFNGYLGSEKNCTSSTIVHEIFHLFGAEDYYDPYGKYPKRKQIAEKYYPNDIMLVIYRNIYQNTVDKYTAYTLGWIDECPKVCNCEDWWR